jgi:glycosyltransferase involved in cell wall biosynthesis
MIKLSILIMTIPGRIDNCFPKVVKQLLKQTENRDDVEILGFFDNKKRSVGMKSNALLSMAHGQYVTFMGDDDTPSPEYVDEIIKAIDRNPGVDVITFDILYVKNGEIDRLLKRQHVWFPLEYFACRAELAKKVSFPGLNVHEDRVWEMGMDSLVKTRENINKILYYYTHNTNNSVQKGTA